MSSPYNPIYLTGCGITPAVPLSTTMGEPEAQLQSPLFGTLYPELRNIVFTHALTEYDDPSRPYSKHAAYYRPDFQFAGRIDTNLLLACRRIYLETHLAPVSLNEHVFWMRRGPHRKLSGNTNDDDEYFDRYFTKMTPQQRGAVRKVRFFTQLYWLEDRDVQEWATGLKMPKVVVTVRHSDWWYWENGEDLHINEPDEQWGQWIGSMPGLQEFELEFETLDAKREQLEERVQVALGWKFPITNGGSLVHDGEEPAKSAWLSSSRMSPGESYEFDEDEDEDEYNDDGYSDSDEYSASDEDSEAQADEEVPAQENVPIEDVPIEEDDVQNDQASEHEEHPEALQNELAGMSDSEGATSPEQLDSPIDERTAQMSEMELQTQMERGLDVTYPMNLTLHVRKFRFVHESRLV